MQYEVKESGYGVTITSAKFDVVITPEAPLNVAIGESARMEVPQAINYIKSGEAEIKAAADIGISRIGSTVTEGLNQFNANATAKTNAFNQNATNKTNVFDLNASDKTTAFNNNASDKTTAFNNNATSKTGDFNTNATNKTNAFNQNATDKTDAFNLNATNKTTAFNDNYTAKKALIDAEVGNAAASATAADNSAKEAKQWAIGDPSEPTGNSAKYWANQAASTLSGLEARVTTIEGDIPAQASSSNQLADKNFVNSSIATNTANFIGTFNSVADLEAYSGQKDDNDYAFVISTDAAGNTLYNRYKWNGTAWLFEYALNNSSFTANQWAAINSGITTGLVTAFNAKGALLDYSGTTLSLQDSGGNNLSQVTIKSTPDLDNKSISLNSDDELQAIGVINQNAPATAIKTWTGTKAQYDAIATKDANTLYNITDDTSASDILTTVLGSIYPVGSVYIGTMSTCPMASLISGSTWTLVASDKVLQGSGTYTVGTTIEAGLPDIQGGIRTNEFGWNANGAFTIDQRDTQNVQGTNSSNTVDWVKFKASTYNSIYGNSSTVQPPAYVVNIWERTA